MDTQNKSYAEVSEGKVLIFGNGNTTSFMILSYVVLKHMVLDMPQALLPRFHALTIGPGLGRATGTGEDGERNY